MPRLRDLQEHEPVIAAQSMIVRDPVNGTNRRIFAGKRIPFTLVPAYLEKASKPTKKE